MLQKFWQWYSTKLIHSVTIVFVIHILQIPHFLWVADVYLEAGVIGKQNNIADFLLYGIDLVEIPSLINVAILWLWHIKNRKKI